MASVDNICLSVHLKYDPMLGKKPIDGKKFVRVTSRSSQKQFTACKQRWNHPSSSVLVFVNGPVIIVGVREFGHAKYCAYRVGSLIADSIRSDVTLVRNQTVNIVTTFVLTKLDFSALETFAIKNNILNIYMKECFPGMFFPVLVPKHPLPNNMSVAEYYSWARQVLGARPKNEELTASVFCRRKFLVFRTSNITILGACSQNDGDILYRMICASLIHFVDKSLLTSEDVVFYRKLQLNIPPLSWFTYVNFFLRTNVAKPTPAETVRAEIAIERRKNRNIVANRYLNAVQKFRQVLETRNRINNMKFYPVGLNAQKRKESACKWMDEMLGLGTRPKVPSIPSASAGLGLVFEDEIRKILAQASLERVEILPNPNTSYSLIGSRDRDRYHIREVERKQLQELNNIHHMIKLIKEKVKTIETNKIADYLNISESFIEELSNNSYYNNITTINHPSNEENKCSVSTPGVRFFLKKKANMINIIKEKRKAGTPCDLNSVDVLDLGDDDDEDDDDDDDYVQDDDYGDVLEAEHQSHKRGKKRKVKKTVIDFLVKEDGNSSPNNKSKTKIPKSDSSSKQPLSSLFSGVQPTNNNLIQDAEVPVFVNQDQCEECIIMDDNNKGNRFVILHDEISLKIKRGGTSSVTREPVGNYRVRNHNHAQLKKSLKTIVPDCHEPEVIAGVEEHLNPPSVTDPENSSTMEQQLFKVKKNIAVLSDNYSEEDNRHSIRCCCKCQLDPQYLEKSMVKEFFNLDRSHYEQDDTL